jgi:hypothetical protein
MFGTDTASKITYISGTSLDAAAGNNVAIESGEPITVHGIILTNTDDTNEATITIRNGADDATLGVVEILADTSLPVDIKFYASAGISFTGTALPASTEITVFHSHPGS